MYRKLPFLMDENKDGAAGGGKGDPWYAGFTNPEVKTWVESYKDAYPTPQAMAEKAWNLEKFVGADKAQRGVIIPKSDAKPEEWQGFWKRVGGVPEKPEGYAVPESLKDNPLMKAWQAEAHKMGLPMSHWNAQVAWFEAETKKAGEQDEKDFNIKAQQEWTDLKGAWGTNYDANIEQARRAAQSFLPGEKPEERAELLTLIEGAIGTKRTMELFYSIGKGISEHPFHQGVGPSASGPTTPEGARLEIANLKKDEEFGKKLLGGDAEAKKKWEGLHRIAAGQQVG